MLLKPQDILVLLKLISLEGGLPLSYPRRRRSRSPKEYPRPRNPSPCIGHPAIQYDDLGKLSTFSGMLNYVRDIMGQS